MEQAEKYLGKFFRINCINSLVFATGECTLDYKTGKKGLVLKFVNEIGQLSQIREDSFETGIKKTKNLSDASKKAMLNYVKLRKKEEAAEKALEDAKKALEDSRQVVIHTTSLLSNAEIENMFKNVVDKRKPYGDWWCYVSCYNGDNGTVRVSLQYTKDVTWKYAHPSYVYLEYDNTEHIDSDHKDYKATLSKQRDSAKGLIDFLKSLQKPAKKDKECVYSDLSVGDKGIIEFHVNRTIEIDSRNKEEIQSYVNKF